MFTKIIIVFLSLCAAAFAAPSEYEVLVNTPQEVPMYAALFDSIHFFFHGTTGQNYMSLLRYIVLFGTIVTVVRATRAVGGGVTGGGGLDGSGGHSSLMGVMSYQLFIVGMLMVLYGRESVLIIKHPDSLRFETTATVPEVFGYTISFFTHLNYKMTYIAETSFSNLRGQAAGQIYTVNTAGDNVAYGITGLGYGGLAGGLSNSTKIRLDQLTFTDGTSTKSVGAMTKTYIRECVALPMSILNADGLSALTNTNGQLMNAISPTELQTSYGIDNSTVLVTYNGTTDFCNAYWTNKVKPALDLAKTEMSKKFGTEMASLYYTNQLLQGSFTGGSFSSTGASSALIKDATEVQEQVLNNALGSAFEGVYSDLGTAGNVFSSGMQASLADSNQQNYGIGRAMAQYMPIFGSFIFMIMIAAFPFMFAFSLMPGGFSIMLNFVQTLAWISLWAPMSAILNFFLDYRLTEHIKEQVGGSVNLVDGIAANMMLYDVNSEAAMMANLAGGLYVMVPALSYMLVTGSGVMLSNITQGLGSSVSAGMSSKAVAENAESSMSASLSGTSYSEMAHYESGSRAAARSSGFTSAKNVYGSGSAASFQTMADDKEKQGTVEMASQRAFGANSSVDAAMGGGSFQGAQKAGSVSGQAMALGTLYGGDTGGVARAGEMEALGSAAATKGRMDQHSVGSISESSYKQGSTQGASEATASEKMSRGEAVAAGTVAGAKIAGDAKAAADGIAGDVEKNIDSITSGTMNVAAKALQTTKEIGKAGNLAGYKNSGTLAADRDISSTEADSELMEKEKMAGGGRSQLRKKMKAAASKKLEDEMGVAEESLDKSDEIKSGAVRAASRLKTQQSMEQDLKTYDDKNVTSGTISRATDTTSAQARGTLTGQAQESGKAATIAKTVAAETSFGIQKQINSFTDANNGQVLGAQTLSNAAAVQGGQAAGAMLAQSQQLALQGGANGIQNAAQTNTGFAIASDVATAKGHRDVSSGNDFSKVADGVRNMTDNADSKTKAYGSHVTKGNAMKSGANDGAAMGSDQTEDASGQFARTESSASKIGKQARRFKNAKDHADSSEQAAQGKGEIGNFMAASAAKQIGAPIDSNNREMGEQSKNDMADNLRELNPGMSQAQARAVVDAKFAKGHKNNFKHSSDYKGAISEIRDDTADGMFNQASGAHGVSNSVAAKGDAGTFVAGAAASQAATSTQLNTGASYAADTKIGGIGGAEGAALVQSTQQVAQVAGQDAAQKALVSASNKQDTAANRASTSGAVASFGATSQALGSKVEMDRTSDSAGAAMAALEKASPAMAAELKQSLGGMSNSAVGISAAMSGNLKASTYNTMTGNGSNMALTVGSDGNVGSNHLSNKVGVDYKADMNRDIVTESTVEGMIAAGAGETTLAATAGAAAVAEHAGELYGGRGLASKMLKGANGSHIDRHGVASGGKSKLVDKLTNHQNDYKIQESGAKETFRNMENAAKGGGGRNSNGFKGGGGKNGAGDGYSDGGGI